MELGNESSETDLTPSFGSEASRSIKEKDKSRASIGINRIRIIQTIKELLTESKWTTINNKNQLVDRPEEIEAKQA